MPFPSPGCKYCDVCRSGERLARAREFRDRLQAEFIQFKCGIGCKKCGYNRAAAALDFHHLNPVNKRCRIYAKNFKTDKGKEEMRKCILLCKNCHYEIHEGENA